MPLPCNNFESLVSNQYNKHFVFLSIWSPFFCNQQHNIKQRVCNIILKAKKDIFLNQNKNTIKSAYSARNLCDVQLYKPIKVLFKREYRYHNTQLRCELFQGAITIGAMLGPMILEIERSGKVITLISKSVKQFSKHIPTHLSSPNSSMAFVGHLR